LEPTFQSYREMEVGWAFLAASCRIMWWTDWWCACE